MNYVNFFWHAYCKGFLFMNYVYIYWHSSCKGSQNIAMLGVLTISSHLGS